MTEEEWLTATDQVAMMNYFRDQLEDRDQLRDRKSERKFRLCACACCRLIWDQLPDAMCRQSVEVGERYADGSATPDELRAASHESHEYWRLLSSGMGTAKEHASFAAHNASCVITQFPLHDATVGAWAAAKHVPIAAELAHLHFARAEVVVTIIRDIFGNPFRPAAFSPSWCTSTAVALAAQMYESRDFGAMPILADALQDAGCDNADILDHCRGPGPHVRGCWVVDLVLGKE